MINRENQREEEVIGMVRQLVISQPPLMESAQVFFSQICLLGTGGVESGSSKKLLWHKVFL